jgi:hypothetical protein
MDPVDVIDEFEANEAMKLPGLNSKDGKGFYDDKVDEDSEYEKVKLLENPG